MIITWALPQNIGGVLIVGYRIYIKTSTATWVQEPVDCDGINDANVISLRSCAIPVTTLRASPFFLTDRASLYAKVIAFNIIGDSLTSDAGNDGLMPLSYTVPGVPTSLTRDDVNTSKTKVSFSWLAPVDNGGSVVLDYSIEWDGGLGTYGLAASGITITSFI